MRFYAEIKKGSFLDRSWKRQKKRKVAYKGLAWTLQGDVFVSEDIQNKELMTGLERDDCIMGPFMISNALPLQIIQKESIPPISQATIRGDSCTLLSGGDIKIQTIETSIPGSETIHPVVPEIIRHEPQGSCLQVGDVEAVGHPPVSACGDAAVIPKQSAWAASMNQESPALLGGENVNKTASVFEAPIKEQPQAEPIPLPEENMKHSSLPKSIKITDEERERIRKKYSKRHKK